MAMVSTDKGNTLIYRITINFMYVYKFIQNMYEARHEKTNVDFDQDIHKPSLASIKDD